MTQRDFDILRLQRPRMDDLAVNQYGDRVYGTPEETLWNDALARAQARIANPRWMAEGVSYDGVSGNIDSPDIVAEELFSPLQEAFHPLQAMEEAPKRLTDVDRSLIESRRGQLELEREKQRRIAFADEQERALAGRRELEEFNLRSGKVVRPANRAAELFHANRVKLAKDALMDAQKEGTLAAQQAAIEELNRLESATAPVMPSFAEPTRDFNYTPPATPPPAAPAPASPYPEGTRLKGPGGKIYVVRNGKPEPVAK